MGGLIGLLRSMLAAWPQLAKFHGTAFAMARPERVFHYTGTVPVDDE
jgi:hypothetical protein